jgi:hypothetical protein
LIKTKAEFIIVEEEKSETGEVGELLFEKLCDVHSIEVAQKLKMTVEDIHWQTTVARLSKRWPLL